MTTSQFFVYRKPIAWTALVMTLIWGVFAYLSMPQRQDPIIPVRIAVVSTLYPGASAEKVEQEITRKIERKVAENPAVEHVRSLSRDGLSVVYVDLFETTKNTEAVWQDLRVKLDDISGELPSIGGMSIRPFLDKDFGDTVAVMLTISSPPVSDMEIELRAKSIRHALQEYQQHKKSQRTENQWTGILVYPDSVPRSYIMTMGRLLGQRLSEKDVISDVSIVEAPSTGMLDVTLKPGKTWDDLYRVTTEWQKEVVGAAESHPDIWQGFWVHDLSDLEKLLRAHARDQYSYRQLKTCSDKIRDRLKQSAYVAKIDVLGAQQEQITLAYSGHRFNLYGITPESVVGRISQYNANVPGGQVELPRQKLVVHPETRYTSADQIGKTIIDVSSDGTPLYLRDMVEIIGGYQDPPDLMNFRTVKADVAAGNSAAGNVQDEHGKISSPYQLQTGRAITLAIRQTKGSQISDFNRDLNVALAELKADLPSDLRMERTSNEPVEVKEKIANFNRNFLEAVAIVVAMALLFMEWRSALLVAVSIPVTVAMTLGFCHLMGVDLQQVSIAALIIALGLLVDDPVVAADAINREIAHNQPRHVAAWLGPQKLARAILFATLTNIVAFLPLLLIKGDTGEFIWSLPIVVTASLVASRIVSMTFVPLIGYYMLRGQHSFDAGDAESGGGSRFARLYKRFVEACIAHRFKSITVAVVLLAFGLWLSSFIGTAFFPKDLHDVLVVNINMPEGTPLRQTKVIALDAIQKMDALEGKNIRSYTTFVGAGGPRFWLSVSPEPRADNYAQVLVHTSDKDHTTELAGRLKRELPPLIAEARVTVEQLETGPPIGVPVVVRLYGDNPEVLHTLAGQVKARMRTIPGATNIHDDWGDAVFQMALRVDTDRAALAGFSNRNVTAMVGAGLSGLPVTQLRQQDKLIDISLRLRPSERSQITDLFDMNLTSDLNGAQVPLRQMASIDRQLVWPKIQRRDHERCLTVLCDAVPGVLPSDIVKQLQHMLPSSAEKKGAGHVEGNIRFPAGYHWDFGGEYYEQNKGFGSVAIALLVSLVAIYLALVLQFNSVTKPMLVYAAVPFGMVAGLMGLLIFGAPFGFMAFLGIASLAGLIISHVIVLFDFIDEMHHRGEPLHKAVVDAGLARLRPVLVTVLATVGGLIPLAMEGGPLWEPMCYVQIAGMLVATVITLALVPVLYVIFVEDLHLVRWDDKPGQEIPADLHQYEKGHSATPPNS